MSLSTAEGSIKRRASGKWSQATRSLAIESNLGNEVLLLRRITGTERLGQPFEYTVDLLSEFDDIQAPEVLGTEVTIRISPDNVAPRFLRGFIARFERFTSDAGDDFTPYRATVVPWLWFLSLSRDCRIFVASESVEQGRTALHVIQDALEGFSGHLVNSLTRWSLMARREFCVQYRESAYNFIQRLLEEEGIYYHFSAEHDALKMVLSDSPSTSPPCPLEGPLRYSPRMSDTEQCELLWKWSPVEEVRPSVFAATDYDFLAPHSNLGTSHNDPGPRSPWRPEVFDYPGGYRKHRVGSDYVSPMRLEELITEQTLYRGATNAPAVSPGLHFKVIADPFDPDGETSYMATSHTFEANNEEFKQTDKRREDAPERETLYHSKFTAIRTTDAFRPQRTAAKPFVHGPQTAVVVGPSSQEIYTDKYARVKVKFHWDRYSNDDETASCFLRVSQPWAGKGWGGIQIPRIGQEVIVDFLEGDPDQPIITGRVYHAESMPPVSGAGRDASKGEMNPPDMKAAAMQMSLRSNSLGHSGGHNEITMHDGGGEEKLFIRAQKDEVHWVKNDRKDTVDHDEVSEVKNDRTDTVGNDETRTVNNNRKRTVIANETINVNANRTVTVQANQTTTINQNRSSSVAITSNDMTGVVRTVETGVARIDTVGLAHASMVGGMRASVVGVDDILITLGGAKINKIATTYKVTAGEDYIVNASGSAGIKAGKSVVVDCADITLKSGSNFIRIDKGGVTIVGTKVKINSGGSPGSLPEPPPPMPVPPPSSGSSGGAMGELGSLSASLSDVASPLGGMSNVMKAIPPGLLPPGVGAVLGPLASGQMPGLGSLLGALPGGVLPPGLQGALSTATGAFDSASSMMCGPEQPNSIAVGMGGTGMRGYDTDASHDPSFVPSIINDYAAAGQPAHFINGPDSTFFATDEVMAGVAEGRQFVTDQICAVPGTPVDLYGYSRGGNGMTLLARDLEENGVTCTDGRQLPANVRYMGLYDPVDNIADGDRGHHIPAGTQATIIRPEPGNTTRSYFNRLDIPASDDVHVVQSPATHAGIGGVPGTGDHPGNYNYSIDRQGAIAADQAIREGARSAGAPIPSRIASEYHLPGPPPQRRGGTRTL